MTSTRQMFSASIEPSGELVLRGELDMAVAPRLDALIDEGADGHALVMDLADLTFVDSTGVLCLVRAWKKTGHPVILRNPRRNVLRFLELCRDKIGSAAWVIESTG